MTQETTIRGLPACLATDSSRRSYLRAIEEGDAAFVVGLRSDASLGRYLSASTTLVAEQAAWIRRYKEREQAGTEWYCIIMHEGERIGTVRMYDFRSAPGQPCDSFCWGSWIIAPPRPKGLVTYSAMMVYDLGLTALGFRKSHFDVRKGNDRVSAFHVRNGAVLIGDDAENFYYDFPKAAYEAMQRTHIDNVATHTTAWPPAELETRSIIRCRRIIGAALEGEGSL